MLVAYYFKKYKIRYSQYDLFQKEFIQNLKTNLKDMEFEFDEYGSIVIFSRKSKYQTLMAKRDIFKVLRKGEISIIRDNDWVLIKSKAELQGHLYVSIFTGVMFSLALGINFNFNFNFLLCSSTIISNLLFFVGYFKIRIQLQRIIKIGIYSIIKNQIK